MARKAQTKKRRSGRRGKVTLKTHAYSKFKPTQIRDGVVRKNWDPKKSPAANMAGMGLVSPGNAGVGKRRGLPTAIVPLISEGGAVELFDIPESDVVAKKTKAQKMLPVSIEDQEFLVRCLGKHGDDYAVMARDIKTNDMQHTEGRLRKMGARFMLLTTEQLRVEVPERVKGLMMSPPS